MGVRTLWRRGRDAGEQHTSPGMASGPKWPCPGESSKNVDDHGEYTRCGPTKQSELLTEPCGGCNGAERVGVRV